MACRPPPPPKVSRARSTSSASSVGSGATESVPVSMRPASSRSPIRPRMWPDCWRMMRWNSRISAGSSAAASSSSVDAEPRMAASGSRSSWLTMPRNSARSRSISSSGARSWMVTTTEPMVSPSARIGVALISTRTLRPSGTEISISSARIVSPLRSSSETGSSSRLTSLPSARRMVITSRSCSTGWPGMRTPDPPRHPARPRCPGPAAPRPPFPCGRLRTDRAFVLCEHMSGSSSGFVPSRAPIASAVRSSARHATSDICCFTSFPPFSAR